MREWVLLVVLVLGGICVGAAASRRIGAGVHDEGRRRLLSDVAHELRGPLQNIRGTLEAAQDGLLELTPERIASLREEALLMERLIRDLQELDAAGADRLDVRPVPTALDELLAGVAATYELEAERLGVSLSAEAPDGLSCDIDPDRVRQVVNNLVENALRHTGPGDRIDVTGATSPSGVRIEVRDTGEGIAPEHLDHVFERLYRPGNGRDQRLGGTGLGLAIARELVHAHAGELEAISEPGVGTTFVVRLP